MDVFHPSTGEVRSDGADGIACWFIDTDYNEESFFVRHAYFLGANDPYRRSEDHAQGRDRDEAWATLNSDTSRPFEKPKIRPHRGEGDQSSGRRGDESVQGDVMLIQNYGLFWRRAWIHWGRGNSAGHLKGTRVSAKTEDPVDFRNQQGVYCLHDESFRLVYVGQAGGKNTQRLFIRLKQHREDAISERWTKFSWFGVRKVIGQGALKAEKNTAHPKIQDVLTTLKRY